MEMEALRTITVGDRLALLPVWPPWGVLAEWGARQDVYV